MQITVKDILVGFLKKNGYYGLVHSFEGDSSCQCSLNEICDVLYDDCTPFKKEVKSEDGNI